MTLQSDVAEIKESLKFLPRQFDELRGDIRRLAETFNEELEAEKKRHELEDIVIELATRVAVLEDRKREGKPDTGPLIAGSWIAEISGMIGLYFDEDELRTLCLLLNIDYESLRGEGKRAKAERLVGYLDRRGRTDELLKKLDQLRPKVAWPTV